MTRLADLALRHATLLIFVAVLLWFGLQAPGFLSPESLGNIVKQSAFIGIAAIGITFVLLTAGIDLSVGSVMYLAPLIAGFAMRDARRRRRRRPPRRHPRGRPPRRHQRRRHRRPPHHPLHRHPRHPLRLPRLRRLPHRLHPVRLRSGHARLRPGLARPGSDADRRLRPPRASPPRIVLSRTTFGRQVYAVGNDPEAARKAGLPVAWVQARVYVISGACAGLAGFVVISQIGRLDAGFGEGREFDVIAAAVLGGASLFGGIGSALGAVVGATLIQTVKSGLVFTGVNLYLQPILMAGIIFLAVLSTACAPAASASCKRRTIRPIEA